MIRQLFLAAAVFEFLQLIVHLTFVEYELPGADQLEYQKDSLWPDRSHTFANEQTFLADRNLQQIEPSQDEIEAFEKQLPKQTLLGKRAICNNSTKPCLLYMHIGKTGGSSFHAIASNIANSTSRPYEGGRHFDWSFIAALGSHVEVLTLLREPISRAVSHFYFNQDEPFGDKRLKNMTLSQYFSMPTFMLETRDIWQDGQAAVSWLTGTHLARWAAVPPSQVATREQMALANVTLLLHLAANRLEKTLWFGLLEETDKSLELLQHALHLTERPILPRKNVARKKHPAPTPSETEVLTQLIPQDLWLYEYAKRLFHARYMAYQKGTTLSTFPPRPPLPNLNCVSTRFNLTCKSGILQGQHYWDINALSKK